MQSVATGCAYLASIVFIAACGAMNWYFWVGQGRDELEGQVLGGISVAIDIFVCLIPFFVRLAVANGRKAYAMVGRAIFIVFFMFSFASALGFAASNRAVVSQGRALINHRLDEAEGDLKENQRLQHEFGQHRFASVVQALILKAERDNRYSASNKCITLWPQIKAFCKDYNDLKIELATAQRHEQLQDHAEQLRKEIQDLKQSGGGQPDDAQAALLASATGFSEPSVKNILSFSIAFLVELGAAFGLYLATGWTPTGETEKAHIRKDIAMPEELQTDRQEAVEEEIAEQGSTAQQFAAFPSEKTQAPALPSKRVRKKKMVEGSLEGLKPRRLQIDQSGALYSSDD